MAELPLPVLGLLPGQAGPSLPLGVRGEVVNELPTYLVRGLPELIVLLGDSIIRVRLSPSNPHPGFGLAQSQGRLPAGSWTGWSEARSARREEAQTMGPCSPSSGPGPAARAISRQPDYPQHPQGTCHRGRPGQAPQESPVPLTPIPGDGNKPGQHVLLPLIIQATVRPWGLGLG